MDFTFDFPSELDGFLKREEAGKSARRRKKPEFKLLSLDDLAALGGVKWLIDGHVPQDSLGMVYGMPSSSKSFLVLDWALHMSAGQRQWYGHDVTTGEVVYVAAEGVRGYYTRVEAWAEKFNYLGDPGVRFVAAPVTLNSYDHLDALIAAIKEAAVSPKLIVFDTFGRCFGGDDNSAKEVGAAIHAMDYVRQQTGVTVLVVHHSTKTDLSYRGSSALAGALDLIVHVEINDDRVTVTCEKMKDADKFAPLKFVLGYVANSRVLDLVESESPTRSLRDKLVKNDQKLLDALCNGPMRSSEWQARSGVPEGSFNRHRSKLVDLGLASQREDGLYELRNSSSSSGIINADTKGDDADDSNSGMEGRMST